MTHTKPPPSTSRADGGSGGSGAHALSDAPGRDDKASSGTVRADDSDGGSRGSGAVAGRLVGGALLGGGALVCGIGLMGTSGFLISRAAERPPVLYLMVAIVAVRAFGMGRGVLRYAERLMSHDAALRLLERVRVGVWERLAGGRTGAAGTLGLVVSAVDGVAERWLRAWLPLAGAVIAGAAAVGLEWWVLPEAGGVLLAGLLVGGIGAAAVTWWASERAAERAEEARRAMSALAVETLRAAPELLAYGAAPGRLAELRERDAELSRALGRNAWSLGLGAAVGALSCGATVFTALALAVPAARDGRIAPVLVAVAVLTPLAAFEAVAALAAAAQQLLASRAADRLLAALPPAPIAPAVPRPRPFSTTLSLKGLGVRWPGADRDALTSFDLELPPGRKVALFGPSGSGKTSLAAALVRFADYTGSATLGGVELRDLDEDAVRRVIGLCAQDAHLFDTTVAGNIRMARPEATDEEIADVMLRAGLDLDPARRVGDLGTAVSGGERQRIALARALLAGFPILILDEPDAHLDEDTADRLLTDLLRAAGDRTVLLITHRPGVPGADPVLRHVDEVLSVGPAAYSGDHVWPVCDGTGPSRTPG